MNLETPLRELEISIRTYNALENQGMRNVRDIVKHTAREILEIPNIGKLSLTEIKDVLAQGGFSLGMKDLSPPHEGDCEMSRAVLTIRNATDRERATRWIAQAPYNTRLEFKAAKRTMDQNAKMWCLLTEVAVQLPWHGVKLRPDDWKLIFMDALKRELRVVPNIDGTGFVNLGRSSSDLSKEEMSQLIELITAFGAQHDVVFRDPTEENQSND